MVGSLTPAKHLVGFEPEPSNSITTTSTLGHYLQQFLTDVKLKNMPTTASPHNQIYTISIFYRSQNNMPTTTFHHLPQATTEYSS